MNKYASMYIEALQKAADGEPTVASTKDLKDANSLFGAGAEEYRRVNALAAQKALYQEYIQLHQADSAARDSLYGTKSPLQKDGPNQIGSGGGATIRYTENGPLERYIPTWEDFEKETGSEYAGGGSKEYATLFKKPFDKNNKYPWYSTNGAVVDDINSFDAGYDGDPSMRSSFRATLGNLRKGWAYNGESLRDRIKLPEVGPGTVLNSKYYSEKPVRDFYGQADISGVLGKDKIPWLSSADGGKQDALEDINLNRVTPMISDAIRVGAGISGNSYSPGNIQWFKDEIERRTK